jgi:hypothetical protein
VKRWRGKSAAQAKQLNDSAVTDHACFADSTDVFELAGLSDSALQSV